MKLTFWGAAKEVTGSMHLLRLDDGYTILIDCGLNYTQKKELSENAFDFPFHPADIDVVILTHAHIDHSGNIPALIHRGFKGSVICTEATFELTKYLLFDSANIQYMEYKSKLNRANKQKRHLVPKPIYTVREVEKSMEHFLTLPFSKSFELNNQASITLYEAGHLLGAASVAIDVKKNGATKRITFTGDLGRSNAELIRVPQIISETSILVSETTYGGRVHKTTDSAEKELMRYIDETCVRLRGRLIIPAFSVGRTQSIVHVLKRLYEKGTLPPVKIFVDSPLAIRTTAVYEKHAELLNQESLSFLNEYKSLFAFDQLYWIEDMAEHDETLSYTDSCVIISAAGMVEGGRIQEHVKNNIRNPFSTILIAGFCAEGTLGHRLLNGQKNISMGGRDYPVYAKIASTDVFSSHPDQHELMKYLDATINEKTEHIFLVHGDEPNLTHMQHMLKGKYSGFQVHVPDYADEYNLN